MKNYELIEKLSKFPAGAKVDFDRCLTDDEITTPEDNENCIVVEIKYAEYDDSDNRIMLS
jgi:hypothetical protein